MSKINIIKEILDLVYEGFGDETYIALHNALTFYHDSLKYDLMGICVDESGNWLVECIGYHAFRVYYIELKDLRPATLNRIKNVISGVISE